MREEEEKISQLFVSTRLAQRRAAHTLNRNTLNRNTPNLPPKSQPNKHEGSNSSDSLKEKLRVVVEAAALYSEEMANTVTRTSPGREGPCPGNYSNNICNNKHIQSTILKGKVNQT